ncbi:MAG: CHRD domain-containing protein [Steroidobacter sp.]
MLRRVLPLIAAPALALVAIGTVTAGDNHNNNRHNRRFSAELKPSEEVPALSSPAARGWFRATIDDENQTISYELSYDGLQAPPAQAHIHIGQRRVNGGISVFLCGNPPTVPAPTVPQPPACPAAPATVTGTLTPANIVGPTPQGIDPTSETVNEFAELVALLRQELAYVNVHSPRFPGGEIRGQVRFSQKK